MRRREGERGRERGGLKEEKKNGKVVDKTKLVVRNSETLKVGEEWKGKRRSERGFKERDRRSLSLRVRILLIELNGRRIPCTFSVLSTKHG